MFVALWQKCEDDNVYFHLYICVSRHIYADVCVNICVRVHVGSEFGQRKRALKQKGRVQCGTWLSQAARHHRNWTNSVMEQLRWALTNLNELSAEPPPAAELVKPHMCGQAAR